MLIKSAIAFFVYLFLGLLAARLCHSNILWAEEGLPLAAAVQMENGKALYREIWFDKPPLLAMVPLLWGARDGWTLRLAGALYALLACFVAYRFAGELWGALEARWAAAFMAFFLTFDFPSAVIPLCADLLMVAPHLAAVYFAWRGQVFWSGVCAGIAFAIHTKGLFVLAACALWSYRALPELLVGFAAPNLAIAGWLGWRDALDGYFHQVWRWGFLYAGKTFVENPIRNAAVRSLGWVGFHAALVIGAACFWRNERGSNRWQWAGWLALSAFAITLGWRFFPRYFFQLLPAMVLLGARGACLIPARYRAIVLGVALMIPLVRFGPRYFLLATGKDPGWADTAMDRDSRQAATQLRAMASPQDTLFIWGFRPEQYIYAGLPAASRFLDSQPVTGVPADRHLADSKPVVSGMAAAYRIELSRTRPTFVLDGLGPYNPKLAVSAYPELSWWLAGYRIVARSPGTIIYRRVDR